MLKPVEGISWALALGARLAGPSHQSKALTMGP